MSTIDLKRFCASKHEPRESLRQPFSVGGYAAASNAALIVFVPSTSESYPAVAAERAGKVEPILEAAAKSAEHSGGDWISVEALNAPVDTCHSCKGRSDHCTWCFGSGVEPRSVALRSGQQEWGVSASLIALLRHLPKCALLRGPSDSSPIHFRFEGGFGALMPMRMRVDFDGVVEPSPARPNDSQRATAAHLKGPSMYPYKSRPLKILADGTYLRVMSTRTDHVAVLLPDEALMVHPYSLGTPDGSSLTNWDACAEACRGLRVLGYSDWELATREDWNPIIDISRVNPAVDTNLYPGIKPGWHWTASDVAWGTKDAAGRSVSAWAVSAGNGYVDYGHRDYGGFALAVRRVGQ